MFAKVLFCIVLQKFCFVLLHFTKVLFGLVLKKNHFVLFWKKIICFAWQKICFVLFCFVSFCFVFSLCVLVLCLCFILAVLQLRNPSQNLNLKLRLGKYYKAHPTLSTLYSLLTLLLKLAVYSAAAGNCTKPQPKQS